jgi:hypothetical protein
MQRPKLAAVGFPLEAFMDIVFLGASAALFVALVGMVIGCDQLGAHQ